jgi:hypothetical protein
MAFLEYKPSKTIFQYCSLNGFFGIVRSKSLWFSDLASTNDPRELQLGYEYFIEALKSVRQNEYQGERGDFLSILAEQLTWYHGIAQPFCCCFSMTEDYLPMWGAYGSNYSGLAIGFRPNAIFDMPARLQKVRYANDSTPLNFKSLVLAIASRFDSHRKASDLDYWIPATVEVFSAVTALKHKTWSYEREIRAVHAQTKEPPNEETVRFLSGAGILPRYQSDVWVKPLIRQSHNGSISYLDFPFGRRRNGIPDYAAAIERVIIGPNCELSESEVRDLLRENGFSRFTVNKSTCEIR